MSGVKHHGTEISDAVCVGTYPKGFRSSGSKFPGLWASANFCFSGGGRWGGVWASMGVRVESAEV